MKAITRTFIAAVKVAELKHRRRMRAPMDRAPVFSSTGEWCLGEYTGECSNCHRERLCLCPNGKHRCEKCNWVPELGSYAPVEY